MPLSYDYIKDDKRDILRHAKDLESYTVGDVYELEVTGKHRDDLLEFYAEKYMQGFKDEKGKEHRPDKGRIGFLVQEVYFDQPRDNEATADLRKAGVELKVSPLKCGTRKKYLVKERLVLGMINRNTTLPMEFKESHIYGKCRLILLIYYIDMTKQGYTPFQFPFYKAAYIKIPDIDMAVIEQDYRYIRDCVNSGRYNDLHESKAKYLSPCTKSGGRAFSLKPAYMNQLFQEYIYVDKPMYDPDIMKESNIPCGQYDSIVYDAEELKSKSFEEVVRSRFEPFIGKSYGEIRQILMGLGVKNKSLSRKAIDKAEFARTTFAMLGIKSEKAEEFVKSNTYVKTLRVNEDGTMDEDISFSAFEFSDLVEESWEESEVYEEMVERGFLWAVFKYEYGDYYFKGAKFWSFPDEDLDTIKKGWEDIRLIVREGVQFAFDKNMDGEYIWTSRRMHRILNSFPDTRNTDPSRKEFKLCPASKPYNRIISIRPHSKEVYYDLKSIGYQDIANPRRNGSQLPNGDIMTKQCFWFNNEYILEQIQDIL